MRPLILKLFYPAAINQILNCSETDAAWLSQKFPNFKPKISNGDGDDDGDSNGDHGNPGDGMDGDDQSKGKSGGDGKTLNTGGKKRAKYGETRKGDGNDGKKSGPTRKLYGAGGIDGSWTFPYYSCHRQAWLASLVIPLRGSDR